MSPEKVYSLAGVLELMGVDLELPVTSNYRSNAGVMELALVNAYSAFGHHLMNRLMFQEERVDVLRRAWWRGAYEAVPHLELRHALTASNQFDPHWERVELADLPAGVLRRLVTDGHDTPAPRACDVFDSEPHLFSGPCIRVSWSEIACQEFTVLLTSERLPPRGILLPQTKTLIEHALDEYQGREWRSVRERLLRKGRRA